MSFEYNLQDWKQKNPNAINLVSSGFGVRCGFFGVVGWGFLAAFCCCCSLFVFNF